MPKELDTSIQYLSGVGPKRAALLQRELGIETLFVLSAVLGLCNSAYAATIKVSKQ